MNFVDWVWQSYESLRFFKEHKNKQVNLLTGSGLCMPEDGLEFAFVPTVSLKVLEDRIRKLYDMIEIEEHKVDVCSEVFFTTKIEGAKTTIERTQQLHNGKPIDMSNAFSEYMILGAFNATKLLNIRGNRVSHRILREVWEALTFGCCENADLEGVLYRNGNVQVGNHVGCPVSLLYDAMDNWLAFYTSEELDEHPFIKAALLHYAFEYIHPFCDGNGRMGRLLMNNFLIGKGYEKIKAISFSKKIDENRIAYDFAFMQSENVYYDCTAFLTYMLQQMLGAMEDIVQDADLISITDNI